MFDWRLFAVIASCVWGADESTTEAAEISTTLRACTLVEPSHFPYVIDWIAFHEAQDIREFILLYRDGEDRSLAYAANQLDLLKRLYEESASDVIIELRPSVPGFDLRTVCGAYNRDSPDYTVALPDVHHYLLAPAGDIQKALKETQKNDGDSEVCSLLLPSIEAPVYAIKSDKLSAPKFVAADAATGHLDIYYDPRDSKEYQRQFASFSEKRVFARYPHNDTEVDELFDAITNCKSECAQDDVEATTLAEIKNHTAPIVPPFLDEERSADKLRSLVKIRLSDGEDVDFEVLDQIDEQYQYLWMVAYPFSIPKYAEPLSISAGGEQVSLKAVWRNRRCSSDKLEDVEAEKEKSLDNPDLVVLKLMFNHEVDDPETNTTVLANLADIRTRALAALQIIKPRAKFMNLQSPRPQIAIPTNVHWECDAGDVWSDRRAMCPPEYPLVGQNLHKIPPANALYVYGWCKKPKENINREVLHAKSRQQMYIDQSDLIMCPGWPEVPCCDNILDTGVRSIYASRVDLEKSNPWGSFTPCSNCKVSDKDTLAALARVRSRMGDSPSI